MLIQQKLTLYLCLFKYSISCWCLLLLRLVKVQLNKAFVVKLCQFVKSFIQILNELICLLLIWIAQFVEFVVFHDFSVIQSLITKYGEMDFFEVHCWQLYQQEGSGCGACYFAKLVMDGLQLLLIIELLCFFVITTLNLSFCINSVFSRHHNLL